jgi:hypothetical protein
MFHIIHIQLISIDLIYGFLNNVTTQITFQCQVLTISGRWSYLLSGIWSNVESYIESGPDLEFYIKPVVPP